MTCNKKNNLNKIENYKINGSYCTVCKDNTSVPTTKASCTSCEHFDNMVNDHIKATTPTPTKSLFPVDPSFPLPPTVPSLQPLQPTIPTPTSASLQPTPKPTSAASLQPTPTPTSASLQPTPTPTSASLHPTPTPTSTADNLSFWDKYKVGIIIGAFILLLIIIFVIWRYIKNQNNIHISNISDNTPLVGTASPSLTSNSN